MEALLDLASRDPLAGLLNRRGFKREAERVVVSVDVRQHVAHLLIDLDRFETNNDTVGHAAGDAVLAETGGRLLSTLEADAVCARLSGDDLVVLQAMRAGEALNDVRRTVVLALAQPFSDGGRGLSRAASVGSATAWPGRSRRSVGPRGRRAVCRKPRAPAQADARSVTAA